MFSFIVFITLSLPIEDLNSDPRSDESPDITHRTLADKTPRNPIGYKVEYRIVGTATDWVTVEYSDLVERPLPGPLEEGYTYEYWISYKYGTQYDKRNKYGTHIEPCRGNYPLMPKSFCLDCSLH